MAMATYREIVYDILETLKMTHDDSDVSLRQIAYWCQLVANKLQYQHILKTASVGQYLTVFPSIPVLIDASGNRKYVALPDTIHSIVAEKGVEYITYSRDSECCDPAPFAQNTFMFTVPSKAQTLYYDPYTAPTSKNPYFYRVGERIYFLGLECIDIDFLELGLYTTINIEKECNLDAEVKLNAEHLALLKYEVTNLGRWSLVVPSERVNEGSDMQTQGIMQNKIKIPPLQSPQQERKQQQHQNQHQQKQ